MKHLGGGGGLVWPLRGYQISELSCINLRKVYNFDSVH